MPTILFADGFLTGSLLSLLLPVCLLIAVVVGFIVALRRLPGGGADGVAAPEERRRGERAVEPGRGEH
jgi:hypothetical protein